MNRIILLFFKNKADPTAPTAAAGVTALSPASYRNRKKLSYNDFGTRSIFLFNIHNFMLFYLWSKDIAISLMV